MIKSWDHAPQALPSIALRQSCPREQQPSTSSSGLHKNTNFVGNTLRAALGIPSPPFVIDSLTGRIVCASNEFTFHHGERCTNNLQRLVYSFLETGFHFRMLEQAVHIYSTSASHTEQAFSEGLRSVLSLVRNILLLVESKATLFPPSMTDQSRLLIAHLITHRIRQHLFIFFILVFPNGSPAMVRGDRALLSKLFYLAEALEASDHDIISNYDWGDTSLYQDRNLNRTVFPIVLNVLRHTVRPFLDELNGALGFEGSTDELTLLGSPVSSISQNFATFPVFIPIELHSNISLAIESLHFLRQDSPQHPLCLKNSSEFALDMCLDPASTSESLSRLERHFDSLLESSQDFLLKQLEHQQQLELQQHQHSHRSIGNTPVTITHALTEARAHRARLVARQERWKREVQEHLASLAQYRQHHLALLQQKTTFIDTRREEFAARVAAAEQEERTALERMYAEKMALLEQREERIKWAMERRGLDVKRRELLAKADAEVFSAGVAVAGDKEVEGDVAKVELVVAGSSGDRNGVVDGMGGQDVEFNESANDVREGQDPAAESICSFSAEESAFYSATASIYLESGHVSGGDTDAVAMEVVQEEKTELQSNLLDEHESDHEYEQKVGPSREQHDQSLSLANPSEDAAVTVATRNDSLPSSQEIIDISPTKDTTIRIGSEQSQPLAQLVERGISGCVDASLSNSIRLQCNLILREAMRHIIMTSRLDKELDEIGGVFFFMNGTFVLGFENAMLAKNKLMTISDVGTGKRRIKSINDIVFQELSEATKKKFTLTLPSHSEDNKDCDSILFPNYSPASPFHLVITQQDIVKYRRIFGLFCRVRKTSWKLQRQRETLGSLLVYHEVLNFVSGLSQYLVHVGLRPWRIFVHAVKKAFEGDDQSATNTESSPILNPKHHRLGSVAATEASLQASVQDMTSLRSFHTLTIDQICWSLFLSKRQEVVHAVLDDILRAIDGLKRPIEPSSHESLQAKIKLFLTVAQQMDSLSSGLAEMPTQQDTEGATFQTLLTYINMNEFYPLR